MKPSLVILAAGMASRYGSMKQVQAFGPSGETIMDYSIYDAIQSGFGKIIFIIREEFATTFESSFNEKLAGKIEVEYVYQDINKFVGDKPFAKDRVKPWGTAHALLCCKGKINEPFAIINADDFYGADAFKKAYYFLTNECSEKTFGILGYTLSNTLSENGSVSRGVCDVDDNGNLIGINERTKIYRDKEAIVYEDELGKHAVSENAKVSMNYMCFAPNIIDLCEIEFQQFLDKHGNDIKSEFFLPSITNKYLQHNIGVIKIIPTDAKWFGVTYKEDAPRVLESIQSMIAENIYPKDLWA
jgi:choline kinase